VPTLGVGTEEGRAYAGFRNVTGHGSGRTGLPSLPRSSPSTRSINVCFDGKTDISACARDVFPDLSRPRSVAKRPSRPKASWTLVSRIAASSQAVTLTQGRKASPIFSDKSYLHRIREQRVTPLVQGPHEVRLGVDRSTFAIAPFSSVGIEWKVLHIVFAGLFPMIDRQRLAIMLAIETGPHVF